MLQYLADEMQMSAENDGPKDGYVYVGAPGPSLFRSWIASFPVTGNGGRWVIFLLLQYSILSGCQDQPGTVHLVETSLVTRACWGRVSEKKGVSSLAPTLATPSSPVENASAKMNSHAHWAPT